MQFIKRTAGQDARIHTQSCQHVFGNFDVDDSSIKPSLRPLATKRDCDEGSFRDLGRKANVCQCVLAYWRAVGWCDGGGWSIFRMNTRGRIMTPALNHDGHGISIDLQPLVP